MHLFVLAGETSGDTHAAALLADLQSHRPDLRISGLGGPKLHALSPAIEDWTHEAAATLELAVRITRQIAERAPSAHHDPLSEK